MSGKQTGSTGDFPIIAATNMVESLRDSGYKSAASAGAELGDNAFQSGANVFGIFIDENPQLNTGKRGAQPAPGIARVVFSDDGVGMDPTTLRNAVRFGYSCRFNDRTGMGRFGMGLPNASVSQARIFTVFTKTKGGEWYRVTVSLDAIAAGETQVPGPKREDPPEEYIVGTDESGTIVIWEDLDRLNTNFKTADKLQSHFVTELSRIFRYFLVAGRRIIIYTEKGETEIKPFDPLYLMNEAAHSGATQHGDTVEVEFPLEDGSTAIAEVRFSLTPVEWQVSPDGVAIKPNSVENKARRLDKNRGVSFVRADREIDFIRADLKPVHPMNMWWSAEVSFPATLDEHFGIEFTKQRVVLTEATKQRLLDRAFTANVKTLNDLISARRPKEKPEVTSAAAEEIAARVRRRLRRTNPKPGQEGAPPEEEIERAAAERRRAHETAEAAKKRIKNDLPFLVITEERPGAHFYRVETYGTQTHVYLNAQHPFHHKVYVPLAAAGGNALTGVQLLLFSLAQAEAQSGPDGQEWYEQERMLWTSLLSTFLRELPEPPVTTDITEELMDLLGVGEAE